MEKKDPVMVAIDEYESEEADNQDFEKYMTNLNVHMAGLRD